MAPNDTSEVSQRRLRKRDADRRFQRKNRERTKSRLQHLENLAEQLRQQDVTGYVGVLMKHVAEIEKQRDEYKEKVEAIESILGNGLGKPSTLSKPSLLTPQAASRSPESFDVIALTSSSHALHAESPPTNAPTASPTPVATATCLDGLNESFTATLCEIPALTDAGADTSRAGLRSVAQVDTDTINPQALQRPQTCHCQSRRRATPNFVHKWTIANQRLSEWMRDPGYYRISSTAEEQGFWFDTPFRGVVDGWASVERRGSFHPAWRLLRTIDEVIFEPFCDLTERVAVMYIMGLLLASHINPTSSDLVSRLPTYYLQHAVPKDAAYCHTYATGYFAWPGLRAKFMASEHRYCSNKFWDVFVRGLKVQLPHQIHNCYTKNGESGLYRPVPMFLDAVMDIKRWTMGPDLFQDFPELWGAVPAYGTIPQTIWTARNVVRDSQAKQPKVNTSLAPDNVGYEDSPREKCEIGRASHETIQSSGSLWRNHPAYAALFQSNVNPNISNSPNSGFDGLIHLIDGSIDW